MLCCSMVSSPPFRLPCLSCIFASCLQLVCLELPFGEEAIKLGTVLSVHNLYMMYVSDVSKPVVYPAPIELVDLRIVVMLPQRGGIFSIFLPVVYGEGDRALGRLLARLLTGSGDTSILAWTGKSGGFNGCLPNSIMVFSRLSTSHVPLPITGADTEAMVATCLIAESHLSREVV